MSHRHRETRLSRRAWLASAAWLASMPSLGFGRAEDDSEIASVRAEGKKAGLADFKVSRNDSYLAIGDAHQPFQARALAILLGLSRDFLKHFTDKGFHVEKPATRMTVIVLSSRDAWDAYLGAPQGKAVGGVYDLGTGRLLMFDNRAAAGDPEAEKTNTLVLFHEATHQLCFSAGLLNRDSDTPLAITEGLATYGECRGLHSSPKFGEVNKRRILGLYTPESDRTMRGMIPPCREWIAKDDRLRDEETQQVGYSEAWLLIHYLMKTPARLAEFRKYLAALKTQREPGKRMALWESHFGDTAKLDRELAAHFRRIGKP